MRFSRHSLRRSFALCVFATTVLAGAAHAASTAADRFVLRGRVDAYSTRSHSLHVGGNDHWTIVDGDGDTDLDCWVYNPAGDLVDSDTDETDYCMLQTPGVGRHRVVIRNLGHVYNEYVVRQR